MQDVTRKTHCRLCDGTQFEEVLPILPSPIGDAFLTEGELHEQQTYPLRTYLCLTCGHLQNLDVVNPDILFRNYTYKTSASTGLVEHFRKYAGSVWNDLNLSSNDLVVEMGSNDGSLLKAFKALGAKVRGVDPATNIAAGATAEGVPTMPDFFSSGIAAKIRQSDGPAKVVCANNVFAHMDNMSDVVNGVHDVLADDGVFVFEVSYIPDMIGNLVFDTIYHEHVSHHALTPLEAFFRKHDMTLFDAQRISTKGGSIRGFAQRLASGKRERSRSLDDLFSQELQIGITKPEVYRKFFQTIEARKRAVLDYLTAQKADDKTIAAYGASTTATTLLYHFELWPLISFIVDDNPLKHGTFSPGAHLPVFPSSKLNENKPDIVVILAWTYADPIIKRHAKYLAEGGQFLVPLPDMKVVGAELPR
jgi:SAM-dependent methyltransferase